MADTLATCGDGCGWIAGAVAAIAYGSFGVPVRQTKHIDVHPLVMQSFKTITMFVLSWGTIFLGVTPSWTWWGLASGFLWVTGGTGGIYAIRMAGLAIAVGTWASVMILINFIWGILVFREPVNDVVGTIFAFVLLALGLVGMSVFASPSASTTKIQNIAESEVEPSSSSKSGSMKVDTESKFRRMEDASMLPEQDGPADGPYRAVPQSANNEDSTTIVLDWHGIRLNKRQAGIAGAIFNGVMAGSALIPLHYAQTNGYGGANYMISMAGGALISNLFLWFLMYCYEYYKVKEASKESKEDEGIRFSSSVSSMTTDDLPPSYDLSQPTWRSAYDSMPVWHFAELTGPGLAAGVLLSVAMFGSILSITYLGQGIGNSIVQTKIMISGLWGIFWFGEIRGVGTITKWFASATVAVMGIIWLSHERILATRGEGGGH